MKRFLMRALALASAMMIVATPLLAQGGTIGGGSSSTPTSLTALINGTAVAPALRWATSPNLGLYLVGADTLGIATGGVASLRLTGGATPSLVRGADKIGFLFAASDSLHVLASNGGTAITFATGAPAIVGRSGALTIRAGTGTSNTLTLQTTTAAGTVKNALVLGADSSATFLGLVTAGSTVTSSGTMLPFAADNTNSAGFNGILRARRGGANTYWLGYNASDQGAILNAAADASNLTWTDAGAFAFRAGVTATTATFTAIPSESSTQNALCVVNATGVVQQNAAASCLVSSVRYKKNIAPMSRLLAERIVFGLKPVTFAYKADNKPSIGLIAEQADSIDRRLATRDAQGRINSINYEQITAALLLVVQRQEARLTAMCKSGIAAAC